METYYVHVSIFIDLIVDPNFFLLNQQPQNNQDISSPYIFSPGPSYTQIQNNLRVNLSNDDNSIEFTFGVKFRNDLPNIDS